MVTHMGRGVFLGGQPRHCICTNASRGLSAIAYFLGCLPLQQVVVWLVDARILCLITLYLRHPLWASKLALVNYTFVVIVLVNLV